MANAHARKVMCQWHREWLARDVIERSRLAIQRHQNKVVHRERKRKVLSDQRNAEFSENSIFPYIVGNVSDISAIRCANKIRLDLVCSIGVNGPKFPKKLFERLLTLPCYKLQCQIMLWGIRNFTMWGCL